MKTTKLLLIAILSTQLFACAGKLKQINITAPNDLQILKQPRAGLKPPFFIANEVIDNRLTFTNVEVNGVNAGSNLEGQVQQGLQRQFNSEFFADLSKDAAVSTGLSIEIIRQLNFDIKARGLKLFGVAPSDVDFKSGTDIIKYITAFDKENRGLAVETVSADTLVISISNIQNDSLKAALKTKLGEKFGFGFDMLESATGKTEYKITGSNLMFAYKSASFDVALYSVEKPLKMMIAIDEEQEIDPNADVKWIRAVRVEPVGDGETYAVYLYPILGERVFQRMRQGEVGAYSIEKQQKMTVTLIKVTDEEATLSIAGFDLNFRQGN